MAFFALTFLHLTLVPADKCIFISCVNFIACDSTNIDILLELAHLADGLGILVEESVIVGWGSVESLLLVGVVSLASSEGVVHLLGFVIRALASLVLFLRSLPGRNSLRNVHDRLVLLLVRS